MDFKIQISFTMLASVAVGQLSSYVCLLVFPAHWGIAPDRALGQDQSRIVLVRMGQQNRGGRRPAVTDDGRTVAMRGGGGGGGGGGVRDHRNTGRKQTTCSCEPHDRPVMNRTGQCPKCSGDSRGLATYNLPETYEVHGMDSFRMFQNIANPLADTNAHFNVVASFITHLFLVYGLQMIKKSSVKMDTLWMAIFVSAYLSVVYTLLASNNNNWKNRSFSTAFMLTVHKFVVMLSMNLTLTMSRMLDTIF